MENNTQPVTAQELPNVAMHPRTGFPSEEAMKAYYLQLIDIMNIAYVKESSEYISLQMSETQIKTIHPCSTIVRYTRMGKRHCRNTRCQRILYAAKYTPAQDVAASQPGNRSASAIHYATGKQCRFSETIGRYLILPLSKCRKLAEEGERRIDRYFLK